LQINDDQDYRTEISVKVTPREAFEKISRVKEWWGGQVEGNPTKLGDTFTYMTPSGTFVDFKITELVPEKKVVWLVTNCYLSWIDNKTEWNGTRLVWELSSRNGTTTIKMAHVGLVPKFECYNDCKTGWNFYVRESLLKFLTENKGMPDGL
jgi:hypothetical protein